MPLSNLFPAQQNLEDILNRSLGTGLNTLAQNNLQGILQQKNIAPQQNSSLSPLLQNNMQPQEQTLQGMLQQPQSKEIQQPETIAQQSKRGSKKTLEKPIVEKPKTAAEINAEVQREKLKDTQNKFALEWVKPYAERAEQARKDNINYGLMKQAAESGKLRTGWKHKLAETFGVSEIERNFEEQLFTKAAASAAASASKIFPKGTRLNIFLEKIAQRTVPSLYNSPEAITGIANINMLFNELTELEEDEAVKIIEENNGAVPYNINSQLNKRLATERKRIEKSVMDEGKNVERSLHEADNFQKDNKIKSLPDATDESFPVGTVIRDDKTGKLYEKVAQNGTFTWKKE